MRPLFLPVALALLVLAGSASAQTTYTWVGGNMGSWQDPTNWSPEGVPGEEDEAVFDTVYGASVSLDQDVAIDRLLLGDSVLEFVSDGSRFTRTGYLEVDFSYDFVVFDLRVDTVEAVYSDGLLQLPDVGRVGSYTSRITASGSAGSVIEGFDEVGDVQVGGSSLALRSDDGVVGAVRLSGDGSTLVLGGGTLDVESIEYGGGNGGRLRGEPGLQLRIGEDLYCSSWWFPCDFTGVNVIVDGNVGVTFGVSSSSDEPTFPSAALTTDDLVVSGDLSVSEGGLTARTIQVDGKVDVSGDPFGFLADVNVGEEWVIEGDADFFSADISGGPGPALVPVEFRSTARLGSSTYRGVRLVASSVVTYRLGGFEDFYDGLVGSILDIPVGGRLVVQSGQGNTEALEGDGGAVVNAGVLEAGSYVRFDVPVSTTGTLHVALYDADTAPPTESGEPVDRFSEAPYFASLSAGGTLAAGLGSRPTPGAGEAFVLFFYGELSGAFDAFDLPALPDGLEWAVTLEDGVALATVVNATEAVACSVAAPLSFADYDADPVNGVGDDPRGEFATVTNSGGANAAAVDLAGCAFVVFDPYTERVTFAADAGPDAVVPAIAGYSFANTPIGLGQAIPNGSIPDGPGAFALVDGPVSVGQSVGDVLLNTAIVAAVVYLGDEEVFASIGGGRSAGANEAEFAAALARLFAVSTEDDDPVDLSVAVWPNPATGVGTVTFGLAKAGPTRVAVYDALGREVAILADGPRGAGRHKVTFDAGSLPVGGYVVRVSGETEVQVARLTVVR